MQSLHRIAAMAVRAYGFVLMHLNLRRIIDHSFTDAVGYNYVIIRNRLACSHQLGVLAFALAI